MRIIQATNLFEKDLKKIKKSGLKNIDKLKTIIQKLASDKKLDLKNRDHQLRGNYKDHRECHIEPDWLLIYRTDSNRLILVRTGSHSELFKS